MSLINIIKFYHFLPPFSLSRSPFTSRKVDYNKALLHLITLAGEAGVQMRLTRKLASSPVTSNIEIFFMVRAKIIMARWETNSGASFM